MDEKSVEGNIRNQKGRDVRTLETPRHWTGREDERNEKEKGKRTGEKLESKRKRREQKVRI